MKTIFYNTIVIAAIAAVAFVSCSKSDIPVSGYPEDGVVRISPTVAVPVTRADGEVFNGSELSLGLCYGENDKYNRTTSLWTKDELGNWNSDTPVLWKNAEDEVEVYAFAPYSSMDGRYASFSIPSDQSAGLEEADMLWYSDKVTPGSLKDGKLDVVLNHALLKMTVKLSFGDEFEGSGSVGGAVSVKEVWLNETMPSFHCNLNFDGRGGLTHPTTGWPLDIKMHKVSDLCYEAIFYPSKGQKAGGNMLTVILSNGRDYHLTLSEDLAFEKDPRNSEFYLGGTAYEMLVKIGKDKLKMGTVTVASWNNKTDFGENHFTDAAEYSEWGGPEDVATAYAGGDGSEGNPFQIATAAQLAYMAQEVNKGTYIDKATGTILVTYFKLTSNIDLMGNEWIPIGENESRSFTGKFDGNGKTILNLNVPKGMYAGLFGFAEESAEIKNLTIRNASVKSKVIGDLQSSGSGIVVGWCNGSSISACSVEGISFGDCFVGGIVGYIGSGKISDCTVEVSCLAESGSSSSCGGIAGYSVAATIENCTVRGEVKGTLDAGGFVGTMEGGAIKRTKRDDPLYCYADVSLYEVCKPSSGYTETYNVGGLVGNCRGSSSSSITLNVPVAGKVSLASGLDIYGGVVNLGGYTGYAEQTQMTGNFLGSIEAGTPTGGTLNAGAFIGWLGTGVKAEYCKYYSSKVGDLPVYGAIADGADDSGLIITTFD